MRIRGLNVSQNRMLKRAKKLDNVRNDPAMQKRLDQGECAGFTPLFLKAAWLSSQPELPQDKNLHWFLKTTIQLSQWPPKRKPLKKSSKKLQQFIKEVDQLQYSRYQCQLDKLLTGPNGEKPRQEFSLAGAFGTGDLSTTIESDTINGHINAAPLEIIAKPYRLVAITCNNHMTGLINMGRHYLYYDSNHAYGPLLFKPKQLKLLEKEIFAAHELHGHGVLGFRVFNFGYNPQEIYPSHRSILRSLKASPYIHSGQSLDFNALDCAIHISCKHSQKYYSHFFPPAYNSRNWRNLGSFALFHKENTSCKKTSSSPDAQAASVSTAPEL